MSSAVIVRSAMAGCSSKRAVERQGFAKLVKTVADAAVNHGIADTGDNSPLDRGVDDHLDGDVLASGPTEGVGQLLNVSVVEGVGGADLGDGFVAFLGGVGDQLVDDLGEIPRPAGGHHERHEGGGDR